MPDHSNPSGAAPALPLHDGYTRELCDTIAGWNYDRLPPEVVSTSKALILDTLGALVHVESPGSILRPYLDILEERGVLLPA